jgi:hypothetical protein
VIDPDLIQQLRQLCDYAQRAGAPRAWLIQTADNIVGALLLLQREDPRRRTSRLRAARMAITLKAMRQAGYTHGAAVAALCERYRLGKSQVYSLLRMFPGT